jgi:hypothetical protein
MKFPQEEQKMPNDINMDTVAELLVTKLKVAIDSNNVDDIVNALKLINIFLGDKSNESLSNNIVMDEPK